MRIAIVEDEKHESDKLNSLLLDYANMHSLQFDVAIFNDPNQFLILYKSQFELVFLDINMPALSGMDVARELRKLDENVKIVFITNMLQYALEGYSVHAMDFIVKPATAVSVGRVMNRVSTSIDGGGEKLITIRDSSSGNTVVLKADDIFYVEVFHHKLTWHTTQGDFSEWGSLDAVHDNLPVGRFSRCHVSYLVNLKHVKSMRKDNVVVGEFELPVSRSQKKIFCTDLALWLGEGR